MRKPTLPALAIGALALAACTVQDEGNTTAAAATNAELDMTPEGPSAMTQLLGGGKPMPLQVQSPHPNGMVLQLTSLQVKPTETVVGMTLINGDTDEQKLNAYPNNQNAYIVAGNGERFHLSPPPTNRELVVQPGQRMDGELVFLGRLPAGQSAMLVLNDGSGSTNRYTNQPGFRVELPLADAAFSDDGSKKN